MVESEWTLKYEKSKFIQHSESLFVYNKFKNKNEKGPLVLVFVKD